MKLDFQTISPAPKISTWSHGVIYEGIDVLEIALGDAHWYGGGGLVHQQYPLEKLAIYPAPFITSDNGHTGLLGILESFWWNSNGAGFWVEDSHFHLSFNAPLSGQPPQHSFMDPANNADRPKLADGIATDGLIRIEGQNLRVRFFDCGNARQVVELFWEMVGHSAIPPASLFRKPLWTTWAHFKNDISHERIADYIGQLKSHQFTASVFGIDAKWQTEFGDARFDPAKFPDPAATIALIHDLDASATLWTVPFYMEGSQNFGTANARGYTLRDHRGDIYIGRWWEGLAAFLDINNTEALDWHLDNLRKLAGQYNIDGFKFDAGEAMFFMNGGIDWSGDTPNEATHHYIAQLSTAFPWSDVRSAWRNQSNPMLFRQWDKSTRWGYDNGIASCITQAITLNMLGYPYSFPDMVGGNQYGNRATSEIMLRWIQAVAPMPFIQLSIPPWEFGDAAYVGEFRRYLELHADLADEHLRQAHQGKPLVRPLWWLDPTDEDALVCADEYVIGDNLLVAPVLEAETDQRDIYLPAGRWQSYWDSSEIHQGQQWLSGYEGADPLPLFRQVAGK